MENTSNISNIKFTPNSILKNLPSGFVHVKIPKKTRIVFIQAAKELISVENANNAIKNLCKKIGMSISTSSQDDYYVDYVLEDKKFNREMVAMAKECLKLVKKFYSKYRIASRYCDNVLDVTRHIVRIVNNEE